MTRMAKKTQLLEAPLTEIEKVRAQTMMRNNRIFQSLGIGALVSMIRNSNDGLAVSGITNDDSPIHGESSNYNPRDDEVIDEEEVNDNVVEENVKAKKTSRRKKCGVKKPRRRPEASTTIMASGRVFAVAPEASKRILEEAEAPPARVTRQKAKEIAVDSQRCQAVVSSPCRDDGFVSTDEGSCVRMDLSIVDHNQQLNSAIIAEEEPEHDEEKRKKRKGAGLERMTKAMGAKMKIHIAEGMIRPQEPVQAAKLASNCGLIARTHTPVLPHFKDYKKDPSLVGNYIGKGNFDMDTGSEVIKKACTNLLQRISKQRRHQIKKDHFNGKPANEISIKSPVKGMSDDEWNALLALWHTPRHKKTCDSNKANREKVKFQQKTGSRCYPAHIFATREERNGEELTAVDLFKSTQTSKKNGLSLEAKDAIVEMERMMTEVVPEGEQRKSDVEIVAAVLKAKECPSSTFLQNVGLKSSSSTSKGNSSAVVAAHVRDLQDKLERSQVEVASLKKRSEDAEAAQVARDKEVELLRKKAEEHDARYAHLLVLIGASSN